MIRMDDHGPGMCLGLSNPYKYVSGKYFYTTSAGANQVKQLYNLFV